MPLTQARKKEYWKILEETGGHKETQLRRRKVPREYQSFLRQCVREERELFFPGLAPVRVILTRAKTMIPQAPLHINFHGGGFVFKQNQDDDLYCAHLAAATGGMVVDVDYASSLEDPFPMALDQCRQVVLWALGQVDRWGCSPRRISLGGSSAGGNLALVLALWAVETGKFHPCLLVLEYAANDNAQCVGDPAQLRSEVFSRLYVADDLALLKDPRVSPVYADDSQLRGLPPTLIIAPGNCPFYHSNNALGMRMAENGVRVTFQVYPDSPHGFIVRMTGKDWQQAQELVIRAIREEQLPPTAER